MARFNARGMSRLAAAGEDHFWHDAKRPGGIRARHSGLLFEYRCNHSIAMFADQWSWLSEVSRALFAKLAACAAPTCARTLSRRRLGHLIPPRCVLRTYIRTNG